MRWHNVGWLKRKPNWQQLGQHKPRKQTRRGVSYTPAMCPNHQHTMERKKSGKSSNTFSQHGQAQFMVSILSSWKSMEQLRIQLMKLLLPRKKIVWQKRCTPSWCSIAPNRQWTSSVKGCTMRMDLKFGSDWFDSQNPPTAPRHGCGGNTFQTQTFRQTWPHGALRFISGNLSFASTKGCLKHLFRKTRRFPFSHICHQKNCDKAYSCTAMRWIVTRKWEST